MKESAGKLRTDYLRLKSALYDPNTDLEAAPAVVESVRALFHHARTIGVIHLEIDPLARVEAVYGWQVLDRLLKAVAGEMLWLRGGSLPAESVITQHGVHADRFLIFVPLPHHDQGPHASLVVQTCASLQDRLQSLFAGADFRAMAPRPVFSIGSATITENPFFRMERQIYRGVEEARHAGTRQEAQERSRQHAELKRIIREQRIEILFQPILHLATERIIGYEAFTRGPRDSMFESPGTLFECSREVGMSSELDLICQRAALKQARRLSAGDKLFLNALPASLLDPGFREGLLADLPKGFPIGRGDIVLEIADRNSIDDFEAFGSEVSDLRARGFRMSIDDVGKASSSLESLSEVHPDYIKVDNSLVRGIHKNLIKQELLKSLCQVARAMNAEVIAEGIETRDELEAVMRCGAAYGQGFLFYRPSRELPARGTAAGRQGM